MNQKNKDSKGNQSAAETLLKDKVHYSGDVFVASSVRATIKQEAAKFTYRETGGALFGYRTSSGDVVITAATGPGPNAKHYFSSFEPDTGYLQQCLMQAYKESHGIVTYVGDWHTHPCSRVVPSSTDLCAMRKIAEDKSFRCPQPVLWIFRLEHQVSLFARLWSQDENILFLDQESRNWSTPKVFALAE